MAGATASAAGDLRRRIEGLEAHLRRTRLAAAGAGADLDGLRDRPPLAGHATPEGSRRLQGRFANYAAFHRSAGDLTVSSIGIGTSRGAADCQTDAAYAAALEAALRGGINLVDTAINYRFQRAEIAVGSALRAFLASGGSRDEVIVCSKAGFLVPGAFSPGSIPRDETEAGFHSISSTFVADQLERSRRNLGLDVIDVYYVHNPEAQLPFIGLTALLARLTATFARLERAVSDGTIRHYGIATWNGLRRGAIPPATVIQAARDVAGDDHHLRFLQLPFNRDIRDAAVADREDGRSVLDIAADAGVTVIASASLGGPPHQTAEEGNSGLSVTEVIDRLQFARSTPGIASALVGMRRADHLRANLAIARIAPKS